MKTAEQKKTKCSCLRFIVGDETEIRVPENQIGYEEKIKGDRKGFGKHNNRSDNVWPTSGSSQMGLRG